MKNKHALARSTRSLALNLHEFLMEDFDPRQQHRRTDSLVREFFARFPKKAEPGSPEEGNQYTFILKGGIKRQQLTYLRLGRLLAYVRDMKLFSALKFKTMADYAQTRLGLSAPSLSKYLTAYDWVLKKHPEWLQPKPKGFIPDLSDINDLRWIENELDRKNLSPADRAALEALKVKGLAGNLRKRDLDPFRHQKHDDKGGLKAFLAKLLSLRRYGAQLATLPPKIVANLDDSIEILKSLNVKLHRQRSRHREFST